MRCLQRSGTANRDLPSTGPARLGHGRGTRDLSFYISGPTTPVASAPPLLTKEGSFSGAPLLNQEGLSGSEGGWFQEAPQWFQQAPRWFQQTLRWFQVGDS